MTWLILVVLLCLLLSGAGGRTGLSGEPDVPWAATDEAGEDEKGAGQP